MQAEPADARSVLYVEPGQLLVSTEPNLVRTILGSCVAVCLYDPHLRQGGMNHFMLPRAPSEHEHSWRYGARAMPALVERLVRLGSEPRQLCANVFGGARVLADMPEMAHLGRGNVDFALDWLEQERITVVASSVLGTRARKVELDLASGACSQRLLGDP